MDIPSTPPHRFWAPWPSQAILRFKKSPNEAVEIWASLTSAGDAFFGQGIYASQRDLHAMGSIEAVFYNNYMKVILTNPNKLRERWDCELCCIPILVDHEACIDVRRQATPEMRRPGLDKWGEPLESTLP